VSLTEYANHISSPVHKQNVEASERRSGTDDREEEYFDKELVDLVAKRKEQLRQEELAAAAKREKEEAARRKQQEFQQRLKAAKERFSQGYTWKQSSRGTGGSFSGQGALNRNNISYGGRPCDAPLSRNYSQQGKSATWHAQEPPNFQNWKEPPNFSIYRERAAGRSWRNPEFHQNMRCDQGMAPDNSRSRLPWLSNGGSSNGIYGWNNISQCPPQTTRPLSLHGDVSRCPPPPKCFSQAMAQNQLKGQESRKGEPMEGSSVERDRHSSLGPKASGSNPKLDKACRWSPYPQTKLFDCVPQKETHHSSSEKLPKVPTPQQQQQQNGPDVGTHDNPCDDKKRKKKRPSKATRVRQRDKSNSSIKSSSHSDGPQTESDEPPKERSDKLPEHRDGKVPSVPEPERSMATASHSGSSPRFSPTGVWVRESVREQQLLDILKKSKDAVSDKNSSVKLTKESRLEHMVQEKQTRGSDSQVGANKENNCRREQAKLPSSAMVRSSLRKEGETNLLLNSQSLQSVQVSTSTMDTSEPVVSTREEEDGDNNRLECGSEEGRNSVATDEAMQTAKVGQGSECDASTSSEATYSTSGSTAALSLSKVGIPPVMTKHIVSKNKTGSHEPNLNIARRVRNVDESRRGEAEKESGLKPTVRQLISSFGSRNVNWEQVYQEVRKKQEQGKGMPRFGIEMVPCDQEDHSQEEEDIALLEGFQWESLADSGTASLPVASARKRCLSESSIAPSYSQFPSKTSGEMASPRDALQWPDRRSSEEPPSLHKDSPQQDGGQMSGQCEARPLKQTEGSLKGAVKALQGSVTLIGDSSSGTELYDAQGTGKKRRAAGDIPNPEVPSLERTNKRRKIKSKKERLQVDQLLAVSLREEELSGSLQALDNSLVHARAALQAAYIEVQRLMLVKQQMNEEMSTLRNKRIELLKGMQGGIAESTAPVKVKEEKMDPVPFESQSSLNSSVSDVAVSSQASQPPHCASTPPITTVFIKQEPLSPVHISSETDPMEIPAPCAHSTTPELPLPLAADLQPDPAHNCQVSPERRLEFYKTNREPTPESFGAPAESKQSSCCGVHVMEGASQATTDTLTPSSDCKPPSGAESSGCSVQVMEKACQATRDTLTPPSDCKPPSGVFLSSRRSSDDASVAGAPASSVPAALVVPLSPSELRSSKRVRKLKKRRVLKKAQGTDQPESSDTEDEGMTTRPRRIRTRRRPSCGSHVSTSTPPVADEDGDREMEANGKVSVMIEVTSDPLSLASKLEQVDTDSTLDMVELTPAVDVVNIESSEAEAGMEAISASQEAQMDSKTQTPVAGPAPASSPDTSRAEPQNLACNEVTSTSEMDVSTAVKPLHDGDIQMPLTLPKMLKASSDVSSDAGEDYMPTEGTFEGHQEAVNAMQVHDGLLYTCSGDRTVKAFDLVSHKCVAVFEGHSSKVNSLLVSAGPTLPQRLYSGSSDQTIRCYSLKTMECEQQFSLSDRVLCLHNRWKVLYAGLANGTVVTFNLKTNKQLDEFDCHGPRAVSCLASAQEGARKVLLVGSYDSSISVRDAKNGLLLRTLEGHTKTVLCMKVVNDLVFSGSSDQSVHAHNIHTGELVRIYKGHSHAVTVVAVLGKVMVTACLDKLVRIYELQSHDRLQVYGGHKDMVMCMAIHKSMIYTGCYDGSVQAVRLNLMQNYRCWWHGCSMIFGVREHLQQHLVNDHSNASLLKCRWKNCDEVFGGRSCSKQGIPMHMQKHADEEAELEP